jgi:hypothetical protein
MGRSNNILISTIAGCALVVGAWTCAAMMARHAETLRHESRQGFQAQVLQKNSGHAPFLKERIFYRNGRMTGKLVLWNNQPWERTLFEYMDELSLYSVQTMVYHDQKISLVRKDLFHASDTDNRPDRIIETWYYHFDKDRANSLRQMDTYWAGTHLVKERQVFDETGGLKARALFEYPPDTSSPEPDENEEIHAVTRMTLINGDGAVVSDYRERTTVDLHSIYTGQGLSDEEIGRRVAISRVASRIPVLIMDGGIDIGHPDLAYKLWNNAGEVPNGQDDDANGLIDDIYGITDNPRLRQPVHDLRLPRFGLPAFSHGTLVASIAVAGRENVALMAASEVTIIHSPALLPNIERLIKSHGVRYTNMSFVFDKQLLASGLSAERPYQIRQLIENTPGTLHVVAAGNGSPMTGRGFNVDRLRRAGDLVPAMLPQDNILVVGVLNTDRLDLSDYPTYDVAPFSNVGEISVDILAPGTQVCGAMNGGSTICEDGTSFAAPYVLNHGVLAVAEANPHLDIYTVKEVLMKTAYIPDLDYPFPVRCGGILHSRRAVAAARWLLKHPEETAETAVLAARRADPAPIPGEGSDDKYLNALRSFWSLRNMTRPQTWFAGTAKTPVTENSP